ncbi:MAG: gamma-glutamylcyclotransferase [Flavisolibacter sp.]|nr:gamma-glutamylcyclotransferase [Flavisolibacter sp.]
MRVNVFFYGLFMDVALLHAKGVIPQNPMLAELQGYSLRIGNRATLVPDANKTVYGSLMSLTHDEIDRLYSDESLKAYRYEPVIVHTKDGRTLPALCFNLIEPPAHHERNEEYARKLKLVAIQCGLPEAYVNSIS